MIELIYIGLVILALVLLACFVGIYRALSDISSILARIEHLWMQETINKRNMK